MNRKICVILHLFMFFAVPLPAKEKPKESASACDALWNAVTEIKDDDAHLLSSARDFLSHCSEEINGQAHVYLLARMGNALVVAGQYSEATPILQLCENEAVRLRGTSQGYVAYCWEQLGEAAAYRGYCDAAETAFHAALEVPTLDVMSSNSHATAKVWLDNLYAESRPGAKCSPSPSMEPKEKEKSSTRHIYGTGFFISRDGLILTNDHVVSDCASLKLGSGSAVQILSRDPKNDLALLQAREVLVDYARFRSGAAAKVGEPVLAFGFPLPGVLSTDGVATSGIVSSLSGINDDPRTLQFSAAIQPGNSGGPLFDQSGHVIGVVEAKLDSVRLATEIGAIPENVGFAIQWAQIEDFLEREGVTPARVPSKVILSSAEIAAVARIVTVQLDCTQ